MKYIIAAFLSIFYYSLQAQNKTPLLIDYSDIKRQNIRDLNLSYVADSISYIMLSNDVFLGDIITSTVTPIDDNTILVYSNSETYKFDVNGKYLGKIYNTGRANNEAITPDQPQVNRSNNTITVSDMGSMSHKLFSIDGLGKMQKKTSQMPIVGYIGKYKVMLSEDKPISEDKNSYHPYGNHLLDVLETESGNIVYKYPNPIVNLRYKVTSPHMISVALGSDNHHKANCGELSDNKYWFNLYNIDTIYMTTDFKDVKPAYTLKRPSSSLSFTQYTKQYKGARQKGNTKSLIDAISVSDRFVFIKEGGSCVPFVVVYDNNTEQTVLYNGNVRDKNDMIPSYSLILKNDIDGVPISSADFLSLNNNLLGNKKYVLIDPLEIFENGLEDKFPRLKEDGNFIVMVVHLKK